MSFATWIPRKGKVFCACETRSPQRTAAPVPFAAEFLDPSGQLAHLLSDSDIRELKKAGDLTDLAVAVALDKAVNGTSLMIILEIGGSYLLFPGDAQWGTWQKVMQDPEWQEMLKKLSFYKDWASRQSQRDAQVVRARPDADRMLCHGVHAGTKDLARHSSPAAA